MKILFVSMNSIHFRRWSDQLRDSGHEVYWFDILDQGYAPSMSWLTQVTGWKKGFLKKRGRTFIKNKLPRLYNALVHKYDTPVNIAFAKALQEIQPDVVHSFALYTSCLPILEVMKANPSIKWIYSSWGSDLYFQENKPQYKAEVNSVLIRVDCLITDCLRDHNIALKNGFQGRFLGVFPGGGGFEKRVFSENKEANKIILKGYENEIGKAIPVIKSIVILATKMDIQLSIFGATVEVIDFLRNKSYPGLTITCQTSISHEKVQQLLDSGTFYVGNSLSDGIPNTMYEAIFSGCIPIQSNPGGATEELITNYVNGYLLDDPTNVESIFEVLLKAISSKRTTQDFYEANAGIREKFERSFVRDEVLSIYKSIL